jgi:succinate-acetate transporter protein
MSDHSAHHAPSSNGAGSAGAVRITVRPLGNPMPLGLFSFGIGMLVLAASSAGWSPVSESHQAGLILAAFVFPLELVAAIMAFLARDTLAATTLGLFTTSWLALGLLLALGAPGAISITEGFFLLAFSGAVISLTAIAATGKPILALTLALSAARAILYGLYEVTSTTGLQHAAGYVAAAIALVAWYGGTAFAVEDLRQRPVLPVLRRGAARTAMDGPLSEQIAHARGEAGVRSQL